MASATEQEKGENPMILLGILESVERNGGQSQRHLAAELGIALGLVNAYLKRCVRKGLVKVSEAPARRRGRGGSTGRQEPRPGSGLVPGSARRGGGGRPRPACA